MLESEPQEREHAAFELQQLGIKNAPGVNGRDAMALANYLAMAIRFLLRLQPELRELRLAAVMWDVWRDPAGPYGPRPSKVQDPVGYLEVAAPGPPEPETTIAELARMDFPPPTEEQLEQVAAGLRRIA